MADVKWIKIATNMFDNRKIRQIETLPEGDGLIVVWVKLLCLAGNVNDQGMVYFTKDIPYTDQMLAQYFNRPVATIKMALQTFMQFGMIEITNDVLQISNWERYQNVEGMDRIREQNRARKAREREKKKMSRDSHVTVTPSHATDIDIDIDKDKDKRNIKEKPSRHKFGEYKNVLLSEQELSKLQNEFAGDWQKRIEKLSSYMASTGKSYKNHLATIRNWARRETEKKPEQKSLDYGNSDFDIPEVE